jgi:hypothetical protein
VRISTGGEVSSQAGRVGDDVGVAGVGLGLALVGSGHAVDCPARHVDDRLTVLGEQGQQQGGCSAGEIHCPSDLAGQCKDLAQAGEDNGLVVADFPAPDSGACVVDGDPPVVGLAGVDTDP